jgi:hypothetical protein
MKQRLHQHLLVAALTLLVSPAALAVDATFSGFATLGWAQSNSDYTYQRFINENGTLKRDTLVAGQLDLRLSPQWSATVQLRAAPHSHDDTKWQAEASWAFVGWRPDNDWLVRAGKLRTPLYLYSESLEVGVSHDMVRLPHELYAQAPSNEFKGLFVTRSLTVAERDYTLDVYGGEIDTWARAWSRDGVPGAAPAGPSFRQVNVRVRGLVLTARDSTLTWRLGYHSASTGKSDGESLPVTFPRVDVGPGMGYWQVDDTMPGPGVNRVARIHNHIYTAGMEWNVGDGWRLAAEAVRMRQQDTEIGSDSLSSYVAVFKRIGDYTPYVSLSSQRSSASLRAWYSKLTSSPMPDFVPGGSQLNAADRMAGESLHIFEQNSQAVGVSYAFSPTVKIKGEWMSTHVGGGSQHFDTPAGKPDARNKRINTFSANVSVAF